MKSVSLNLLEASGPVQARNGIAFYIANEAWKARLCLSKAEDKKASNT